MLGWDAELTHVAPRGWAAAWRERRNNPLARLLSAEAHNSQQRRSPYYISPWMTCCSVLLCALTAYLLWRAYLAFGALGSGAVVSTAAVRHMLAWAFVQLADSAALLSLCWLLERLATAYRCAAGLLLKPRLSRHTMLDELVPASFSGPELITGALLHVLRLTWLPLLAIVLGSAAAQLSAVLAARTGGFAPAGPGWPGGELAWLIGLTGLSLPLRLLSGTLALLAGALLLLCCSPYWRTSAPAQILAALAVGWHALAYSAAAPGHMPWGASWAGGWLALVFATPAPWLLLIGGLGLLALEAQLWHTPRARQLLARGGLGALRLVAALGLLGVLLLGVGRFADFDTAYYAGAASARIPLEVRALLPQLCWPLQAASATALMTPADPGPALPQLPALGGSSMLVEAQPEIPPTAMAWLKSFGLQALLMLLLPLLTCIVLLGHARSAVWLRRRGVL